MFHRFYSLQAVQARRAAAAAKKRRRKEEGEESDEDDAENVDGDEEADAFLEQEEGVGVCHTACSQGFQAVLHIYMDLSVHPSQLDWPCHHHPVFCVYMALRVSVAVWV